MRLGFQIGPMMALALLSSHVTQAKIQPALPAEASLNTGAGRGDWLYVTIHLQDAEQLLFCVDTGSPVTVLDKSLEPMLGNRVKEAKVHYAWKDVTGGVYQSPKLYMGNTQLLIGNYVWTDDLSQNPGRTNSTGRPLMGILGMDCMRHYCIQLDFAARRVRFLDPAHVKKEGLGRAFPLRVYPSGSSGYVTVGESFTGTKRLNTLIDTGDLVDGTLEPKEFQLELQQQPATWTNCANDFLNYRRCVAFFPKVVFFGETYTNVFIERSPAMRGPRRPVYLNAIGLPFLARHVVTFNFPKQVMYLRRKS